MILMDAQVEGKTVSLLLDTGATATSVDAKTLGLNPRELRLQGMHGASVGVGVEGDYVIREVMLRLADYWLGRPVLVVDLSGVNKRLGMKIDGIVGQDVLRTFRAVRIDYKNQVVELEE